MSSSTERRFAPLHGASPLTDVRDAARAAGYAEGWAAGRRDAQLAAERGLRDAERFAAERERSRDVEVDLAVRALRSAADSLETRALPSTEELGDLVVAAALALAESVLDTELSVVEGRAVGALRRAMAPLPVDAPVVVRLHPDDVAALSSVMDAGRFAEHQVALVSDSSLSPGDSVAEQGAASVDARVSSALHRAALAMGAERLVPHLVDAPLELAGEGQHDMGVLR